MLILGLIFIILSLDDWTLWVVMEEMSVSQKFMVVLLHNFNLVEMEKLGSSFERI